MKYIQILTFTLMSLPTYVMATEHSRQVEIGSLLAIGATRLQNPTMENSTRIYFKNNVDWQTAGCRNDAADVRSTDTHLISMLLIAWTTNQSITVNVEDTIKPDGEVCQVSTLKLQ